MAQPPLQLPPRGPRAPPFPQLTQPFLLPQTFYVPGSAPLCPLPGQEQPFPPAWAPPAGGAPPAPQAPPVGLQRAPCGCWFDPRVFHIQWSIPYGHQGTALAPAPAVLPASTPGYQHTQGQWAPLSVPCTATAAGAPGGRNIPRSSYVPTSPSAALRHQAREDPAAPQGVSEEILLEEAHRLFGVSRGAVGSSSSPTAPDPAGTGAEGSAVATAPWALPTATHDHQDSEGLRAEISSTATPTGTPPGTHVPPSPSAAPTTQEPGDLDTSLGVSDEELMEEALRLLGCPPAVVQLCQSGASSSPTSGDTGDTQGEEAAVGPASLVLPAAVPFCEDGEGPLDPPTTSGTATTLLGTPPGSSSPLSPSAALQHTAPGDLRGHTAVPEEVPLQDALKILGCSSDVLGVPQDAPGSSPGVPSPAVPQRGLSALALPEELLSPDYTVPELREATLSTAEFHVLGMEPPELWRDAGVQLPPSPAARAQQRGQKRGHRPWAEPPSKRRAL